MAHIKPFKGVLYNPKAVGDLSKVVAPPYDVISEKMQDEFYSMHDNNVIRLILGKTSPSDDGRDNRYTRARDFFTGWLADGVLVQDREPSIYVYRQRYCFKEKEMERVGFIALMKIEDPHESRVLPHEYTFPKPKEDRFNLLKTTNTNMSPVFAIFEDEDSSVGGILGSQTAQRHIADVEQEGVSHTLWRLSDPALLRKIVRTMEEKVIFIADGHHRYEVALNFRDWARSRARHSRAAGGARRGSDHDYIMVFFSGMDPEALTILSTHRVIRDIRGLDFDEIYSRLESYFAVEEFDDRESMFSRMEEAPEGAFTLGMHYKGKTFFTLTLLDKSVLDDVVPEDKPPKYKELDVTVLHNLIFDRLLNVKERVAKKDNILYTRDIDQALELVDNGDYKVAFFMNPPKVEQVREVATSRERMPRKTTYFYPKPLSGLVFYKMESA